MKEEKLSPGLLKAGTRVHISFKKDFTFYTATIVKIDHDSFLTTYLMDYQGNKITRQPAENTPVILEFTDENGLHTFYTNLTGFNSGFYRFAKPLEILRIKKRKYCRFKTNIITDIGVIKDISATGMLITSFVPLTINDQVEIELRGVTYKGVVVRKQGARNYGIKLINLTEPLLKHLVKFIFEEVVKDKQQNITFLHY